MSTIDYAVQQEIAVIFGKEAVAGTEAPTIDTIIGGNTVATPHQSYDPLQHRVGGGGRNIYHNLTGPLHVGSEVEFLLQNGQIFYWALGACATQGTYEHTCSIDTPLPSLSIEFLAQDLALTALADEYSIKHLGCKVNELKIAAAVGEAVKATASFIGMSVVKEATPPQTLATPLATSPFTFEHASLTVNSVDYANRIKSFEMSINNGLIEGHTLGGLPPAFISEGGMEMSGTLELVCVDSKELDLFMNESEVAMAFVLERTASTDDLTIEADLVRFFEHDQPFDMDGEEIRVNIPFSIARTDLDVVVNDAIADYGEV